MRVNGPRCCKEHALIKVVVSVNPIVLLYCWSSDPRQYSIGNSYHFDGLTGICLHLMD